MSSRVVIGNRGDGLDRALGNDEHVRRRLAGDVVEGEALIIFEDDFRWNFFVDDSLKDRFLGHGVHFTLSFAAGLNVIDLDRFIAQQNGNTVDDRIQQVAAGPNQPAVDGLVERSARLDFGVGRLEWRR